MPNDDFDNEFDFRDRTVPPEEDYYKFTPVDLNFNSREEKKDFGDEPGINPTLEYEDIYSGNDIFEKPRMQRPPAPDTRKTLSSREVPSNRQKNNRTGKKKKKIAANKKLTAVFSVLLALVLLCVFLVEPILSKINYDDKKDNTYISENELISSKSVTNILLLGVDARAGEDSEASRADSMMLISLDSKNHTIKLTSFLRDTWIYIPSADKNQRLNAACTYGGYSGVVDTIEYNFGIKIDGYVVADFEMFKVMVDSIGGVEVEVTEKEANEVTNHPKRYGHVTLDSGTYTLTGEQALAYCRIRKIDTDWKRTERQRTVIQAIIKGLVSSGPFGAYKMASSVAPYIETDLSKSEIRSLAFKAASCITGGFEQNSCPFEDTWKYANKGGASVITLNLEENKEKLIHYIYTDSE